MSFSFGGGNNPYQTGKRDDFFISTKKDFNFEVKKTVDDISLFDITTEDELNDTGSLFSFKEVFDEVPPEFDGPKWLGLTGKGTFGDEPKLMQTSFLKAPPRQTDRKGQPIKREENPGNDWSWNTLV